MIYTKTFYVLKSGKYQIETYIKWMLEDNESVLRYAIVEVGDKHYKVDASITSFGGDNLVETGKIPYIPNSKFTVVNIVPTGVRAEVGGYIADATPVTNVLAEIADQVIVHPNVVNGSFLNYARDNVLYVEGHHLDNLLQNKIGLNTVIQNRIGVIIDRGAINEDPKSIDMAINTIESLRVIAGINCIGYKITDEPIGGHAIKMPSRAFCGEVKNPETLINAARALILKGATAIAIATHIDIENMKEDLDAYFKGNLANPFGGTEALISHTICDKFHIPAAHAPILSKAEKDYYDSVGVVDPRASSEVVSPGYLGCILKGLNRSPQVVFENPEVSLSDVKAIIVPYSCCGGIPALMASKLHIPLIAVTENKTVLNVSPINMKINAIIVNNYWEACGVVAALKAGVSPDMLRRPIRAIQGI